MNLVIDANIFAGYYKESVIGLNDNNLTSSTIPIFNRLGINDKCYFDCDGMICLEWKSLAEPEWFDVWYADSLRDAKIVEIQAESCVALKKTLRLKGFPSSKDIWYIRTCKGVKDRNSSIFLITEDLDFYDPAKKNCPHKTRIKILKASSGEVAKHLKKKENILVKSVIKYNEIINSEAN